MPIIYCFYTSFTFSFREPKNRNTRHRLSCARFLSPAFQVAFLFSLKSHRLPQTLLPGIFPGCFLPRRSFHPQAALLLSSLFSLLSSLSSYILPLSAFGPSPVRPSFPLAYAKRFFNAARSSFLPARAENAGDASLRSRQDLPRKLSLCIPRSRYRSALCREPALKAGFPDRKWAMP